MISRHSRFAALVLGLVVLAAQAQAQALPEPRVVRVNERVYVLLGPIQHANAANQGFMINATAIVGDRGVILVDSGGSLEVGRHLAASIRRITVNTHHHGDHYLGNAAFEGATFISSEKCRALVLETGGEWLSLMERDIGRKLPGTRPIAAEVTHPAGAKAEWTIHGVRMVFWVPRGSHTAGDLLVHLPDDKVLIAGDVLVNGIVPTFQDGFVRNWIATLDEAQALGAVHFIPGHGEVMAAGDVATLRSAIARFHAGVKAGHKRGESEAQMRKSPDLADWEKLERAYVLGRNINRAYLEVEAESFDER